MWGGRGGIHPARHRAIMNYEILPLAITKVEWSIFVDVCQRILGVSPTRGLDATHLNIEDPAAYLACLDMKNTPLESLRKRKAAEHFSISFAMVLDDVGLCQLANTPLHYMWQKGRREYLCIVTGTMDEWHRSIFNADESSEYELRWIMNVVLARFEQAGFREVFSRFKKQKLADGTFVLKL